LTRVPLGRILNVSMDGYRAAATSHLATPPLKPVLWNIWNKGGDKLLGQATAQTAYEAYRLACLTEPFSEVRMVLNDRS
jgi:hypothetical protein